MKESPRVTQANDFINVDFLQNESFLRLLFSYVGDVKSLVRASQVNKHWHSVIQKDEALWESISRYYGHCKYPEETWRDFVQEMYCPINTSSPIQLPLSLECAVCARRNRALKQQDPKEYQSKLCSLDLSKEDSKPAAACVHCSHYVEDHIIHMEYRETQVERAVQAHDDGDFKKKVMLVSSIIRVSGGRLRTLEKNLFKSSISFYAHYLTDSMRRTEQSSKYKSYLSELLLLSKKINRLLDEYLIPFATLDNLPSLLEIKALYLEYIAKYSQVTKEEISAKDSANHLRKILLVPSQFPLQYTLYCKDVLGNLMRAYRVARLVKDPVLELKEIIEKIEESRVIHRMKCERIRYQGYLRRKDNLLLSTASSSSAAISAVAPPGSPAPPSAIPPTPAVSVDQDQLSMPLWVIFGYWDSQKCMFIYKNTESDEALEIIFLNRFPVVFTVSTDTEHCWLQIQSSSGQMYELKATNAKERTEWCHALLE